MSLTMKDLEQCFKEAKYTDSLYVGVKIQAPGCPEPEVIINSSENFDFKLKYYQRAYNDDLTLKSFNQIRITDCCFGDSYDQIECTFEEVEGGL